MIKHFEYKEEADMKKIVFICLIALFIFGCSSGADKPKENKQAPKDSTVQTEKPAPVTSLSGDYIYNEVRKKKFKHEGRNMNRPRRTPIVSLSTNSGSVIYKVNTNISTEPEP